MYEPLNDIPHVAIIRQFAFPEEMNAMKKQVHSTPRKYVLYYIKEMQLKSSFSSSKYSGP